MNHMSDYLKNKVIRENLHDVFVGLFHDKEVMAASYKRITISFLPPIEGQTSNTADVFFPIATELWGDIVEVGIFDAKSEGNLLFKAPVEFVKTVDVSSQYKIPKNYLIIRLK